MCVDYRNVLPVMFPDLKSNKGRQYVATRSSPGGKVVKSKPILNQSQVVLAQYRAITQYKTGMLENITRMPIHVQYQSASFISICVCLEHTAGDSAFEATKCGTGPRRRWPRSLGACGWFVFCFCFSRAALAVFGQMDKATRTRWLVVHPIHRVSCSQAQMFVRSSDRRVAET